MSSSAPAFTRKNSHLEIPPVLLQFWVDLDGIRGVFVTCKAELPPCVARWWHETPRYVVPFSRVLNGGLAGTVVC